MQLSTRGPDRRSRVERHLMHTLVSDYGVSLRVFSSCWNRTSACWDDTPGRPYPVLRVTRGRVNSTVVTYMMSLTRPGCQFFRRKWPAGQ